MAAQTLRVGEQVVRGDGSLGVVTAVGVVPGTAVRYNLTVQDLHTYLVGDDQWVVHNCPNGEITDENLYAFGNKAGPRGARPNVDIPVDENGMVHPPTSGENPEGASTFNDPNRSPLRGHFHKLPAGTELPDGLTIANDGSDVEGGYMSPGHRTIYPTRSMPFYEFNQLIKDLPWEYGGKV